MAPAVPEATPHPLKAELKQRGIALWQLARALGDQNEPKLSRLLAGIDPLPLDLETRIRTFLAEVDAERKAVRHE